MSKSPIATKSIVPDATDERLISIAEPIATVPGVLIFDLMYRCLASLSVYTISGFPSLSRSAVANPATLLTPPVKVAGAVKSVVEIVVCEGWKMGVKNPEL